MLFRVFFVFLVFLICRQELFSSVQQTEEMILSNGIRVFIISNPGMQESVASLAVEAGSWDDPEDLPGTAHFVEHLVFLENDSYPLRKEQFLNYLRERGGDANASTGRDRTVYGFSVYTGAFAEALERFSHLFIDPSFDVASIKKEIYALEHEFIDSRENDRFRIWRIFKETGNPGHPNRRFSAGNIRSLQEVTRERIIRWFQKKYVSKKMHLVIASSLPLEQLKEFSRQYFSRIPEGDLMGEADNSVSLESSMSSDSQKGSIFVVASSFNTNLLSLIWEVPKSFLREGGEASLIFLQKVLNTYGNTGLQKALSESGLATEVQSEFWKIGQEEGIFKIEIALSEKGRKEYRKAIEICFCLLNSLKKEEAIRKLSVHYKVDSSGIPLFHDYKTAMDIALKLSRKKNDSEILHLNFSDIERKLLEFSNCLSPDQAVYFLLMPSRFVSEEMQYVEQWMGASYTMKKISEKDLNTWKEQNVDAQIDFFSEKVIDSEDDGRYYDVNDPIFVVNTPFVKIRLIKSPDYSDAIEAFFFLDSPYIGRSVRNATCSEIFIRIMSAELEKVMQQYPKLHCSISVENKSVCLFLRMPLSGASSYMEQIFRVLKKRSSEQSFEKARSRFSSESFGDPDPAEYAQQILDSLILQRSFTSPRLYREAMIVSYEEYVAWESVCFQKMAFEGVFLGDLESMEACQIWQQIAEAFPFTPYKSYDLVSKKVGIFQGEKQQLFLHSTHRTGNALLLLITGQGRQEKSLVIGQFIASLLQPEFFHNLRTEQQLAYKLHNRVRMIHNAIFHEFSLQSGMHSVSELLWKVEQFLQKFIDSFEENFPIDRFERFRNTMITFWKNRKHKATEHEDRVFIDRNLTIIRNLSYQDVLLDIQRTFSLENGKKIAVLIEGTCCGSGREQELSEMGYEVKKP